MATSTGSEGLRGGHFVDADLRFSATTPTYEEVLAVRAERVAMVRDFLAAVTPGLLDERRPHPGDPEYAETVRSCLHVILEEEWEHHRFAVRDLDTITSGLPGGRPG